MILTSGKQIIVKSLNLFLLMKAEGETYVENSAKLHQLYLISTAQTFNLMFDSKNRRKSIKWHQRGILPLG